MGAKKTALQNKIKKELEKMKRANKIQNGKKLRPNSK